MKNFFAKLPSIVWVFLLPLGLIAVIGGIILFFTLLTQVEGVASIIMIIAAVITLRAGNGFSTTTKTEKASGLAVAIGISFFALMGMSLDQPGNFIYNKPIEVIYCKDGTHLNRSVDIFHPLPGRTDVVQDFACVDSDGIRKGTIDQLGIIAIRFVEYVVVAYVLIFLNALWNKFRRNKVNTTSISTDVPVQS